MRIAGPIMIAAKPGNWLFVWIVHCPMPRLYSTSAPSHLERRRVEAVEVELVDLHDLVGLGERRVEVAPLVGALPHQVAAGVLVDRRARRASSACRASVIGASGSYSISTSSDASRASSRVSATTATIASPT